MVRLSARVLIGYIVAFLVVEGAIIATTGRPSAAVDPYGQLSFGVLTLLSGIIIIYGWEIASPRA